MPRMPTPWNSTMKIQGVSPVHEYGCDWKGGRHHSIAEQWMCGFWGTTFLDKAMFSPNPTAHFTTSSPRSEDSTFKKPGGCTLMWVLQVVKPWMEWAKRWPCFAASLQLRLVKMILDPPSGSVLTRWQSSDSSLHLLKHQKSVCLKE